MVCGNGSAQQDIRNATVILAFRSICATGRAMAGERTGQTAVVFVSQRTADDEAGYSAAAAEMEALAATQPGYRGIESVRGSDNVGVTISYWADEASAVAWRGNADHARIRDLGRARWYQWYRLYVTEVRRDYSWSRD
jgi:heme-degrading monooxygenase HmoA